MAPEIFRHYQRTRQIQRLAVSIPASVTDWVDTGLHPCIIGTRPVCCGWKSRRAYNNQIETYEAFELRIKDIRVRFVPDPSVLAKGRCFVYVTDDPAHDRAILKPMTAMTLDAKDYTLIRFPMESGRIQVRLAGSKPTDEGTVRVEFAVLAEAPDDVFIMEATADKAEVFDINSDQLPELPPLPDP